jgi:hypothetical protein
VLAEHGVCGHEIVEGGQLYIFTDAGFPNEG